MSCALHCAKSELIQRIISVIAVRICDIMFQLSSSRDLKREPANVAQAIIISVILPTSAGPAIKPSGPMGKTAKNKAVTSLAAAKKKAKVTESVKHMQQRSVQHASARALEELNEMLKDRPLVTQHLLSLLDMNAFDGIDKGQEQDSDKLPPSCNKFALLAKGIVMGLVCELAPALQEWINNFPKKASKKPLLRLLCYMCHVSEESALPSKNKSVLAEWCMARWQKHGRRLSSLSEEKPPTEDEDVDAWIGRLCDDEDDSPVGYWSLSCNDETVVLQYNPSAETCPLPQNLLALGDSLDLADPPLGHKH